MVTILSNWPVPSVPVHPDMYFREQILSSISGTAGMPEPERTSIHNDNEIII